MKSWIQKAIALSVLLAGHNQSFLQAITDSLDGNNGRAYITNRGVFFRNLQDDKNGYE